MRRNPVLDSLGAYPIAEVQHRARALRDAGLPLVDFSIGDPREPTPEPVKDALRLAIPDVSQYPTVAGLAELRGAIAEYLHRRFEVVVDPDTQVIPTSGSKEAIFSTPLAFVTAGKDAVAYGSPGYPIYDRGAAFAGASRIPIRLGGDFVMRAGDLSDEQWEAARIVWLCTPHNPTGSVTSMSELADLVEAARRSDTLLCSDECYVDVYEGDPPPSVLQVAGPQSKGVLSFLSLSKRSGMTGYRSGAMVGDAEAIAALKALRSSTGTAPAEFVQMAAVTAWGDDVHAKERRGIFAEKRRILREVFETQGFPVIGSTAGIYLWVGLNGADDVEMTGRLLEAGIVVSPGSAFGAGGEGHLRLALVPTIAECGAAAAALAEVLG